VARLHTLTPKVSPSASGDAVRPPFPPTIQLNESDGLFFVDDKHFSSSVAANLILLTISFTKSLLDHARCTHLTGCRGWKAQ
jgi:hypothetical protein